MAALNKAAADDDLSLTQLRVLAILRDRRLRMTALGMTSQLTPAEQSRLQTLLERMLGPDRS